MSRAVSNGDPSRSRGDVEKGLVDGQGFLIGVIARYHHRPRAPAVLMVPWRDHDGVGHSRNACAMGMAERAVCPRGYDADETTPRRAGSPRR